MSILDQIASGGLTTIIGQALSIVNKFITDPQAQVQAQIEMMKITQSDDFKKIDADLQSMQMQADINKVEAASSNGFVAGWRPFIGWICGVGLALQVIIFPCLSTVVSLVTGHVPLMPEMPIEVLMVNLTGMLGLGAYRTYEKVKGVNNGGR